MGGGRELMNGKLHKLWYHIYLQGGYQIGNQFPSGFVLVRDHASGSNHMQRGASQKWQQRMVNRKVILVSVWLGLFWLHLKVNLSFKASKLARNLQIYLLGGQIEQGVHRHLSWVMA